jgi:hypothetical protein
MNTENALIKANLNIECMYWDYYIFLATYCL